MMRYFKQTAEVLDLLLLLLLFLSLVPISVFIVDLNAGLWHVLLTSTDDDKLGCTVLKHRNNDNDLGKLEKWFGK